MTQIPSPSNAGSAVISRNSFFTLSLVVFHPCTVIRGRGLGSPSL